MSSGNSVSAIAAAWLCLIAAVGCATAPVERSADTARDESFELDDRARLRNAESVLVAGGESPDGRYAIRLFQDEGEPSDYALALVERGSGRILKVFEHTGGYRTFETVKDSVGASRGNLSFALNPASWHVASRFVAISDGGTKTSQDLYLYELRDAGRREIRATGPMKLPDYRASALGKVGATRILRENWTVPCRWVGDILHASFTFNATDSREEGGENGRFVVQFSLRVSGTSVMLESMGTPEPYLNPPPETCG